MKVSIDEKKSEAIRRMKLLGLFPPVIKQFKKSGLVCLSEPPFGAHFGLDDDNKKRVAGFEKEHNALVYTGIRNYTNAGHGTIDSFLFVSDHKEEWDSELSDNENTAYAWVLNHNAADCYSDMGEIGIARTLAKGLCRVW